MAQFFHDFLFSSTYRKLRYRTAWYCFALVVIGGAIPGARAEMGAVAPGLVLHAVAYGTITFLLLTGSAGPMVIRATNAVFTVAAMGALDEAVQSLLPYRHGTVDDWLVDVGAAIVCAVACWLLLGRRQAA